MAEAAKGINPQIRSKEHEVGIETAAGGLEEVEEDTAELVDQLRQVAPRRARNYWTS